MRITLGNANNGPLAVISIFVWHLFRSQYSCGTCFGTSFTLTDSGVSFDGLKSDKKTNMNHSEERQQRAAGSYLNIRVAPILGM